MSLLPLAVGMIVLTTAVPVELRPAFPWNGIFDVWDVLQNLVLYAPLGIALCRRRSWIVIAAAFALSATAEAIQIWSFERFSSPYDVVANILGAMLGAWVCRWYLRDRPAAQIVLSRTGLIGCGVAALLILAIWRVPIQSAELTNWDPSFRLLLGNETTGDRPWKGTITSMRILRGALMPDELSAISAARDRANSDPLEALTLYRSSAPVSLEGGPAEVLPQSVSKHLVDGIQADGAFTLVLQLKVDELTQSGPARIVSFSGDTSQRNFDLGQEEGQLVFRVRTPVSGPNGEQSRAETPPILQPGQHVRMVANYDGAVSRIFVAESLYGRCSLAAAGCVVPAFCDSAAPLAWAVLGAVAAIFSLALMPWPRRSWKAMSGAVLAGLVPIVVHLTGWSPTVVLAPFWMKYMALAGAALIAVASYLGARSVSEQQRISCTSGVS